MSGLLIKDFLVLKKQLRILGITLIFYAILGVSMEDMRIFISSMLIFVFFMLISTSFSYDDYAKWDIYALSMPVSKDQLVKSKYILSLLLIGTGMVLAILMCLLIPIIKKQAVLATDFISIAAVGTAALILASIILPLIFRFGAERARIFIMVVAAVPFLTTMTIQSIEPAKDFFSALFTQFSSYLNTPQGLVFLKLLPAIALILCACIYMISYVVSKAVYQKKE